MAAEELDRIQSAGSELNARYTRILNRARLHIGAVVELTTGMFLIFVVFLSLAYFLPLSI